MGQELCLWIVGIANWHGKAKGHCAEVKILKFAVLQGCSLNNFREKLDGMVLDPFSQNHYILFEQSILNVKQINSKEI